MAQLPAGRGVHHPDPKFNFHFISGGGGGGGAVHWTVPMLLQP